VPPWFDAFVEGQFKLDDAPGCACARIIARPYDSVFFGLAMGFYLSV